ncbi:undecaprenyl-diphosphatase [Saccharopolyspora erythraea NRRL 2338]|uniref:Phosphatase PAP2 family protein n=1 Tax=Saccharopolyspora erythraea TaxID=1836 RepID=A0ABP3NBP5_SACER|nr:membrane protein [Saccharopolyspora erythraea D]PFG92826.1 undecaprenyl-diphosphatase [Saccharopolyspora erythraea NRRL 2338]
MRVMPKERGAHLRLIHSVNRVFTESSHPHPAVNEIEDVPDVSAHWYRAVTDLAADAPGWLRAPAPVATEAIILIFLGLFVLTWWRARAGGDRQLTAALLAPVATAVAYLGSELLKTWWQQERPCRAVRDIAATLAECPEPGDWSLPSNHSAIAAASAVALAFAWRRLAVAAVLLALLEGFSRVYVGAHYPHDVIAGFLLGALVATAVMPLTGPLTPTTHRIRSHRAFRTALDSRQAAASR